MNIEEALLQEHSKSQALKISDFIGDNPQNFSELMKIFFNGSYRLTQRASWVVSLCAEKYPELIFPYLGQMLQNLKGKVHDAVKRNTLRILQKIEIPENLLGLAAEVCFNCLGSKNEPVAIKAFAMTVLYNITRKETDLKKELIILIEDQMPYESAAFSSRGRKILKALQKQI